MHTQHGIRRWVLSVLVVLVAASAALGTGHGASAEDDHAPYPIKGYISKEHFKELCEIMGGTFTDGNFNGDTYCDYPDGSSTYCDANGQDCWRDPARQLRPGVEQTYDETAPLYESPTAADAGPSNREQQTPLDPAPVVIGEDDTGGVPTGEQAPSGPATRPRTEPLAPVVDTPASPDAQPAQEPVREAGALVAAPVAEQP